MTLTLSIPDRIAAHFGQSDSDREQIAREALAIELYRRGEISLHEMGELAGVGSDYWSAEEFRIKHQVPIPYTVADLEADRETLRKILP